MVAKKAKRVEIQWIDDDFLPSAPPHNTVAAKIMNRSKKVHVKGIFPWDFEILLKENDSNIPDLFLVDFKLDEYRVQGSKKYPLTGEGLAGMLLDRYKLEEVPVYLVSKVLDDETAQKDDELFELMIPRKNLTQKSTQEFLIQDALDYRAIRSIANRHSVESIHSLLQTAACSREQLEEALPIEFRKGLGKPWGQGKKSLPSQSHGSAIRFSRWVRRTLLREPGLLYDNLYAATFLGITEKAFVKRFAATKSEGKLLASSKYSGVFARESNRRWWKLSIAECVFKSAVTKKLPLGNVWQLAPQVFSYSEKEKARCAICKDYYPETVAYDPDDPTVRKPVHRHCSTINRNHNPAKHFEQFRIL